MLLVVDDDDPELPGYAGLPVMVVPSPGNMATALNLSAMRSLDAARVLGFIGDDHRFRTPGWDRTFVSLLDQRGGGMVYGDDGFRVDGDIPTQIFISSSIVRALGWMALPGAKHLYLDNAWRVLGDSAGVLYYMPDIVVEHMHPAAGKGEWDAGHVAVNAKAVYDHDAAVFARWLEHGLEADVAKVKAAVGR